MLNISIKKAKQEDIEKILPYLGKYTLDCENIVEEQFVIATVDENLAGFGRIKRYKSLCELSSIGVIEEYRTKGVGKKIIQYLITRFPANEIWLVTKIPEYFRKFGFYESKTPPDEIIKKSERVCSSVFRSTEGMCFMVLKK